MSTVETAGTCTAILDELERAVVGRRRTLELVLIGILAGGHVLLEDLPGLGKTLIARSFARVLGLEFARIQFTPDLLPSDVTGAPLYDQRSAEMVFRPGPVFTQLLLADEINRTPPKTQAALLEAMALRGDHEARLPPVRRRGADRGDLETRVQPPAHRAFAGPVRNHVHGQPFALEGPPGGRLRPHRDARRPPPGPSCREQEQRGRGQAGELRAAGQDGDEQPGQPEREQPPGVPRGPPAELELGAGGG